MQKYHDNLTQQQSGVEYLQIGQVDKGNKAKVEQFYLFVQAVAVLLVSIGISFLFISMGQRLGGKGLIPRLLYYVNPMVGRESTMECNDGFLPLYAYADYYDCQTQLTQTGCTFNCDSDLTTPNMCLCLRNPL